MGTSITDWAMAEGATYIGAGTAMPGIWFWVALVGAVVPLAIGFMRDAQANK